jgi:PST family polysaccharide transporter
VIESSSYRQILRSTSIVGGASVINICLGLLRTKVAAMLLGPAGIGLIGLFNSLVATASGVAGLGLSAVGTRQIAQANATGEEVRLFNTRRALFWGTVALAALGALVFWGLRGPLAHRVMNDPSLEGDIGWLAVAVALSVASASQYALLNGMRRIGDLARISVWSGLASTLFGVLALLAWGRSGVLAFVIAGPVTSFVIGAWYVSRLPKSNGRLALRDMFSEWRVMAGLGLAFMVAGLAATVGQLAVRLLVQRDLGVESLGNFQAAWAISMTYIGFVLGAMGTDFYPRLTAIIDDHSAVNVLVNEQIEVALLLAAPVLLVMLGMAPWVIALLYSTQFGEAVVVLQWQILGDVLKIASWPLGFILLASGSGKTYMATEWLAMSVFVGLTLLLLPTMGLAAAGVSFLGMYVVYLVLVFVLAKRRTGFKFSMHSYGMLVSLGATSGVVMLAASRSVLAGSAAALVCALAFSLHAIVRLAQAGRLGGPVGQVVHRARQALQRLGIRHGR